MPERRAIVIVLDGVGIGALPDAADYGDAGSNTLKHTLETVPGTFLPNLARLGLGNLDDLPGVDRCSSALAAHGVMHELSAGKDTTTGHWELMGVITETALPTYPLGFPSDLLEAFSALIGRPVLGGTPASGTQIIRELGAEHVATGRPIVYTSADSVFQIACHEAVVPLPLLYEWCETARTLLTGEHAVARVIARPFEGGPPDFMRTDGRRDFAIDPPWPTQLDLCLEAGLQVHGVGKVQDIFAQRGFTSCRHTKDNAAGIDALSELMASTSRGLIFANLNDTDSRYGHRNDPVGFAGALAEFDHALPGLLSAMRPGDLLIITADHGCDPTTPSTDHTRERVPVLVAGAEVHAGSLGIRRTFADVAATVAEHLGTGVVAVGTSLLGSANG